MLVSLPLFLTLLRLILGIFVIPILISISYEHSSYIGLSSLFFLFLGITDFFDGFFARRLQQESMIGSILDPVADKALVASCLVTLLSLGKIYVYWVIILLVREFYVMGLRLILADRGHCLVVSRLAKIKTALQIGYGTLALYALNTTHAWLWFGQNFLLCAVLFASIGSAAKYSLQVIRTL